MSWNREELFFDGDAYFSGLLADLETAQKSVELESYIFELDGTGEAVIESLIRCTQRGVHTRLLVDGFGSLPTCEAIRARLRGTQVRFHVYHPFQWPKPWGISKWFGRANRRDHRKLCIVDGARAWLGSFNVADVHRKQSREDLRPWRDTGVRIEGQEVLSLLAAFDQAWRARRFSATFWPSHLVRLNYRRTDRARGAEDLLQKIRSARSRVWLTTPYFVPGRKLLAALKAARSNGADVRLLGPALSDVPGMRSVAATYYGHILKAGGAVYQYQPSVLHAKTALIDDWATVGSSNLNQRSLHHDLEADVVLQSPASIAALADQFELDLKNSICVTPQLLAKRSWTEKMIGAFGSGLRHWL